MITTTRSPVRKHRSRIAGVSLVEVLIGASISATIMAAVLSSFLFLSRSGATIANYTEMESEARRGLEIFAIDTRQASSLVWNSATEVSLTVNSATILYKFDSGRHVFTRTDASGVSKVVISGVKKFELKGYMITGAAVDTTDLSTATKRANAGKVTKQLQISMVAERTPRTSAASTNTVISARFILRNKRVTA